MVAAAGLAGSRASRAGPAATAPRAPRQSTAVTPQTDRLLDGHPLDVNGATVEELTLLPRIGPALAARIVEERSEHGRFQTVDELERVRGIGSRTVERLRPLVRAGP